MTYFFKFFTFKNLPFFPLILFTGFFFLFFLYPFRYSPNSKVLSLSFPPQQRGVRWNYGETIIFQRYWLSLQNSLKEKPWKTGTINWNEQNYKINLCLETRLTDQKKAIAFLVSCRHHFCKKSNKSSYSANTPLN